MRATLEHVLTDAAFEGMISVADRYTAGVRDVLASRDLPWTISQLGARAEYRFCPQLPRDGGESAAAAMTHGHLHPRNGCLVAYQPLSSCRAITMRWICLVPSQIWGS